MESEKKIIIANSKYLSRTLKFQIMDLVWEENRTQKCLYENSDKQHVFLRLDDLPPAMLNTIFVMVSERMEFLNQKY